ncbi:MAG: cell wall-active antibiotics response protein [Oscillospiraceae bacterium]|jgi:hypothetical protein|nr:cell wall-active antibiotics response protein [Oscillospiraceae bacterium]
MKRSHFGGILVALALILLGVALIGYTLFDWTWISGWWTILLAALALLMMIKHRPAFPNIFLLLFSIVSFARWQDFIIDTWDKYAGCVGAVAVISLGLSLVLNFLRPQRPPEFVERGAGDPPPYCPPPENDSAPLGKQNVPFTGEEFPVRFALFSSENLRSDCKNLRGARLSAIFGGIMADLRQADFAQPISIEANCLFGGVDVLPPPGVRVECVGTSIFGGCDARAIAGRPYDPAHPVLTIRYLNLFGGTNVK